MATRASTVSDRLEAFSSQQARFRPSRHDGESMGDNVYTSSDSDSDDVDDEAVLRESRPLLVNGEQVDHQQVERPMQDPAITGGQSSGSFAPASIARRRRTPLKWTEVIWITVTLSLIAVLGYSSQLCIMLPYYHKTPSFSPQGLAAVLVPFNLGLLGIFYNYWLCVTTDPGSVPFGYQPDWSALDPLPPGTGHWGHSQTRADLTAGETEPTLELKQALYRPRYCKTCSAYKPPRTHHCKTCQRCVLRMDHHCPWVANCVGHHNYAHFLRFLFYVDLTCVYHLVMVSCRVLDRFNSYTYWREPSTRELVWLVVNYALCIPVILLVGIFSIYHFYCTAINQTTIESWEKDRTATMIRRGRIRKVKYPYDLGVWSNCKAVLGENPLLWCIPNATLDAGDGLTFPVAKGLDVGAQYRWPPKDPTKSTHPLPPPLFSPFTYGTGFNPSLEPTNSTSLRLRHPDPSISSDSDQQELQEQQAVWQEPSPQDLATVSPFHISRSVHIRRGSEGYEVRPRSPWVI